MFFEQFYISTEQRQRTNRRLEADICCLPPQEGFQERARGELNKCDAAFARAPMMDSRLRGGFTHRRNDVHKHMMESGSWTTQREANGDAGHFIRSLPLPNPVCLEQVKPTVTSLTSPGIIHCNPRHHVASKWVGGQEPFAEA